jgi:hypothetical protein
VKRLMTLVIAGLVCHLAAWGQAESACSVEASKKQWASGQVSVSLGAVLTSFAAPQTRCVSYLAVARLVGSARRPGGRKLEDDVVFDPVAAQAQRQAALADPEIAAELAADLKNETDPLRRLFIEAAVMHDNGKQLARDLLLLQLQRGGTQ